VFFFWVWGQILCTTVTRPKKSNAKEYKRLLILKNALKVTLEILQNLLEIAIFRQWVSSFQVKFG
jgi:hypothetical protein